MPTEQRVINARGGATSGAQGAGSRDADDAAPAPAKSKKKVVLLVAVVLLLVGGGAGWWFLMGPGASSAAGEEAPAEPEPEPGAVQVVESISINLAGGHYLRLGLGLQLTAEVAEEVDTARALDIAIDLYSNRTVDDVVTRGGRTELKAQLAHRLEEAYHGEVMDVYLTDYVTQ